MVIVSTGRRSLRGDPRDGPRGHEGPRGTARCASSTCRSPATSTRPAPRCADVYAYDVDDLEKVVVPTRDARRGRGHARRGHGRGGGAGLRPGTARPAPRCRSWASFAGTPRRSPGARRSGPWPTWPALDEKGRKSVEAMAPGHRQQAPARAHRPAQEGGRRRGQRPPCRRGQPLRHRGRGARRSTGRAAEVAAAAPPPGPAPAAAEEPEGSGPRHGDHRRLQLGLPMPAPLVRIATRRSPLARWQARARRRASSAPGSRGSRSASTR